MGDNTQHRAQDFIDREQGRHFCVCGCDEAIRVRREHYTYGIPWFRPGHNARTTPPHQRPEHLHLREELDSVIAQYDAGASCAEIATSYDVSLSSVWKLLKKAGVERRRPDPPNNFGPDHPGWKGGSRG